VTSIKKFNLQGEEIGSVEVSEELSGAATHSQLVKEYLVAIRYNARQWSANTKTRSEVKHTTKKPFPQKGQGRARQGCLVAPQYRGGGRVFGPKPRGNVRIRMNQKEKRASIYSLIGDMIRDGKVIVVDSLEMTESKTRAFSTLLKGCGFTRQVLILGEGSFITVGEEGMAKNVSVETLKYDHLKKSIRNIPNVEFSLVTDIDGYRVARAHNMVISEGALSELERWVKGENT
jgi:large subunit ribosomal protein L4